MPQTLQINIISEQTIPNILFIKQFEGETNNYIFVSTKKMNREGQLQNIIDVCQIQQGKYRVITVNEESLADVETQLETLHLSRDDRYTVNITGGTKIMSLGVYKHFESFSTVEIYYIPVFSQKVMQIFPEKREITLSTELNLFDYLSAYGVAILSEEKTESWKSKFNECSLLMSEIKGSNTPPERILNAAQPYYSGLDKRFLTGLWLEIWLALTIQNQFKIPDTHISFNVKLTRARIEDGESTEYDVVYVIKNRLYIGECKYFPAGFNKQKINKDWYKLAGLQLQMGLHATPFLVTANTIPRTLQNYLQISHKIFRIKGFAGIEILADKNRTSEFLNKLL